MSSFLKENKSSYQPKVALVHDDFNLEGLFILSEAKIRDEVLYLGRADKTITL